MCDRHDSNNNLIYDGVTHIKAEQTTDARKAILEDLKKIDLPVAIPNKIHGIESSLVDAMHKIALASDRAAYNQEQKPYKQKKDSVNNPPHYTFGKFEVIQVIEDWKLDFHEGNVIKYVARSKHKGARLEDLKKARWYLDRLISNLEKNQE